MNLQILLQHDLGSLPAPPPAQPTSLLEIIGDSFPLILAGLLFVAMTISVLYRHNQRFHDFWEEHICGWMEEHAHRCEGERR